MSKSHFNWYFYQLYVKLLVGLFLGFNLTYVNLTDLIYALSECNQADSRTIGVTCIQVTQLHHGEL